MSIPNIKRGVRFGGRVVLSDKRTKHAKPRVLCLCDCGSRDLVEVRKLRAGLGQRCRLCSRGAHHPSTTHGAYGTVEYRTYFNMLARCQNPSHNRYEFYKNVKIDKRWLGENGFENFVADMGPKPTPHHSIDRKDNDGDYTPENCRWATPKQQARNRHNSMTMTYEGETKTVKEWSEQLDMKYSTLRKRILSGWTPERAVTTPTRRRKAGKTVNKDNPCRDDVH